MPNHVARLLIITGLAFLVGCGAKPQGGSQLEMSNRQKIGELMELLSAAQLNLKRGPASVKELEKFGRAGPFAQEAVARGDFVVFWNVNLGEGEAVVAYEKDAPTNGGWVLLQNRTLKQLTAAEFQAAPKAGKPSP